MIADCAEKRDSRMRRQRMLDIAYAARSDVTIERESLTIISELPRQPISIVRFRQFAVGRGFIIL